LDWFRFAQHAKQNKQVKKTFLIYNRAWQGTREYRIKFVEFLYNQQLIDSCQTTFNSIDPESQVCYKDHVFKNSLWQSNQDLSLSLPPTLATSSSSADFNFEDYESTEIEIVLETLFDDNRQQLTEKTLRPIACAQPFILASSPGSLSYLRDYGFKTFHDIWDETYDQISNHYDRLQAIAGLMKEISEWDHDTKKKKILEANKIAQFNKQHFFSQEFFHSINLELKNNLKQALDLITQTNTSQNFLRRRKQICQFEELKNIVTGKCSHPDYEFLEPTLADSIYKPSSIKQVLTEARKYYMRSLTKSSKQEVDACQK
jgi:hypothetical protein